MQDQKLERLVDGDDLRQQVLRSAVEPMKVLEHEDHRRQSTARLRQPLQELARSQADQYAVQALQRSLRRFKAEQIEQQAEVFSGAEADVLQTFVQLARHDSFAVAWRQPECPAHDLDEGQERRLLPVRRTASSKDPRALLDDLPEEFMHEARLADARLSDDVEDLDAGADGVEAALQFLQFPVASDVAREAALDLGVKPRRALSNAVKPIRLLRLGLAFDLMLADKTGLDQPLHQSMSRFAHDRRAGFGQSLQARRDIHRVAQNRDTGVGAALHLADDRRPGIEADPQLWARPMFCFKIVADGLQPFRGSSRPPGTPAEARPQTRPARRTPP